MTTWSRLELEMGLIGSAPAALATLSRFHTLNLPPKPAGGGPLFEGEPAATTCEKDGEEGESGERESGDGIPVPVVGPLFPLAMGTD